MSKTNDSREAVVFIHGIWASPANLFPMSMRVQREGYKTSLFGYNSVIKSPEQNAKSLARFIERIDADVIHLVAHSLGGLVLKHCMHAHAPENIGQVVMLGTPLKGSEVAHQFSQHDVTKFFLGRSTERGLLGGAPPWPAGRPLGMIAGRRGFGLATLLQMADVYMEEKANQPTGGKRVSGRAVISAAIEGNGEPNDGLVNLSETISEEVTHRYELRQGHTGMLLSNEAAKATLCYLQNGNFDRLAK